MGTQLPARCTKPIVEGIHSKLTFPVLLTTSQHLSPEHPEYQTFKVLELGQVKFQNGLGNLKKGDTVGVSYATNSVLCPRKVSMCFHVCTHACLPTSGPHKEAFEPR